MFSDFGDSYRIYRACELVIIWIVIQRTNYCTFFVFFFWIPPIETLQYLIDDFVGIFCKEQDKENVALTQNPNIRSQTKISKTAACLCKNDTSNQPTNKHIFLEWRFWGYILWNSIACHCFVVIGGIKCKASTFILFATDCVGKHGSGWKILNKICI